MLTLLGCGGAPQDDGSASAARAALAAQVRSTQLEAVAGFNQDVERALARGEVWPKDAVLVARRFEAAGSLARAGALTWSPLGGQPDRLAVVLIQDQMSNDSVRGRRLDLVLARQRDGSWRVEQARSSWRCWRSSDDAAFDAEPCP